jgi:hypothetical protein
VLTVVDSSFKILAVAKLLTYNQQARGQDNDFAATKPVLRRAANSERPGEPSAPLGLTIPSDSYPVPIEFVCDPMEATYRLLE